MSEIDSRSGAIAPASGGSRPSVIQLVFREKGALYAAYIPLDRKSTRLNSSH